MAAKKTGAKKTTSKKKDHEEREERVLPSRAPQGVPGTPRGKCAFPKGWTAENEINPAKAKPCNRDAGKGKWCGDHAKEVRYYQLALNNIPWRARIKKDEAGHYYWRGDRPTMAALTNPKLLAKAREQALARGLKAAEVDRLIKAEIKRTQTEGARSNPSIGTKTDKSGTKLILVSTEIEPVQTRMAGTKPAKAQRSRMSATLRKADKLKAKPSKAPAKATPAKKTTAPVKAKKTGGSKPAPKAPEPTPQKPKVSAPPPAPHKAPPPAAPAGKKVESIGESLERLKKAGQIGGPKPIGAS